MKYFVLVVAILMIDRSSGYADSDDLCEWVLAGVQAIATVDQSPDLLVGKTIDTRSLSVGERRSFLMKLSQLDARITISGDSVGGELGKNGSKWSVQADHIKNGEFGWTQPIEKIDSIVVIDVNGALAKRAAQESMWIKKHFDEIVSGSVTIIGKRLRVEELSREQKAQILVAVVRQSSKELGFNRVFIETDTTSKSHIGAGVSSDRDVTNLLSVYDYESEVELREEIEGDEDAVEGELEEELEELLKSSIRPLVEKGKFYIQMGGQVQMRSLDRLVVVEVCSADGALPYDKKHQQPAEPLDERLGRLFGDSPQPRRTNYRILGGD